MNSIKNKYYFEALDHYPYNLQLCLEALNYALSYDADDADSLCLMGRLYSEILKNYEEAKMFFQQAMQSDVTNINTPQYYITCLLNNNDLDEAEKLICYSLNIKGIDKYVIFYLKSVLYEMKKDYHHALILLKEAKEFCYNQQALDFINQRKQFIKTKMGKKPKKDKKKAKKVKETV